MPGPVSHLDGMREVRESLQALSTGVQRNVGKKALKAGPAAVFARAVKAKAPVSSRPNDPTPGSLRDSVKVVDSKTERGSPRVAVIADDIAAVPNEFGLTHRDFRPNPFFRPAIAAAREEAGAAMARTLKPEVDAAAARAARKAAKAG